MNFKQRLALSYIRTKFRLLSFFSKKIAAEKAFDLFCTPQHRTIKLPSAIFNKAEKLQFALEDIPIHGYRWNHNAAKTLLLIHGFQSSIVNFEQYIQPLVSKGYEVLAFDAPGHGSSGGKMITGPLFAKQKSFVFRNIS